MNSSFITAIATPLDQYEDLIGASLEKLIIDQFNYGVDGILVAGSMGAMQLLKDSTYHKLVENSIDIAGDKGEILIGAGDTGLQRTKERIAFLNQFSIDGVAILCPFFWKFPQPQLICYFKSLADFSKNPIYLYDLPQVVGTKLSLETIKELSKHPNIAGGKFSCGFEFTRQLFDLHLDNFRVIISKLDFMDITIRYGIKDQLDGIYCLTPFWCQEIKTAAQNENWQKAALFTKKICQLREHFINHGFPVLNNLMNKRGIEGNFAPKPFRHLDEKTVNKVLESEIVLECLKENPLKI